MAFIDGLRNVAKRAESNITKEKQWSEAQTKQWIIVHFIKALGYDMVPDEVVPEFHADIGAKKGEKVDYAILKQGNPVILIECKPWKSQFSEKDLSQLFRYFTATDVRFGIWTNGLIYRFYSELKEPNRMDPDPFLEFRLDEPITEKIAANLEIFTKSKFDEKSAINEAKKLRYIDSIKRLLLEESKEPSEKFAAFIVKEVSDDRNTKQLREEFRLYIKEAFQAIVDAPVPEPEPITSGNSDDPGEWVCLSEYIHVKGKKLKQVCLGSRSEIKLKYNKDLLVEIVGFLYRKGRLKKITLPYHGKMGTKRYLIHKTPEHPTGRDFHLPRKLTDNDIFLETNLTGKEIIRNCKQLLEDCGEDPTSIYVI